ncbi:MAG: DnaA regulatory inactivator Hda [Woeseiaceae bacterium]|nr:DnaA regulatory inactivator Hda [Woeseiaceae bacterium]
MNQLALPLQLADHAVFASFLAGDNETLVATLVDLSGGHAGQGCWLWGPAASGKTHLLQAVCDAAGDRSAYLPLDMLEAAGPGILEGLESRDLVCIDDAQRVAGNDDWEIALFSFYNALHEAGGQLIVAATTTPRESEFALADLASRLSKLPVFQLQPLSEQQRVAALQLRARHRGLELPGETAAFMLKRSRRDMASLYRLLDRLDLEALKAKRRLTIPFVRGVLKRDSSG